MKTIEQDDREFAERCDAEMAWLKRQEATILRQCELGNEEAKRLVDVYRGVKAMKAPSWGDWSMILTVIDRYRRFPKKAKPIMEARSS